MPDQLSTLCTTDVAQIGDVLRRWFALTIDPSVADPDYLAAALNMPLGTIIRESLQSPHMPRLQSAAFADEWRLATRATHLRRAENLCLGCGSQARGVYGVSQRER